MSVTLTLFCSICKRHVSVTASSKKDAELAFTRRGHDATKVRKLRRGPVGVYKTEQQLAKEIEAAARAKAAKEVETHEG